MQMHTDEGNETMLDQSIPATAAEEGDAEPLLPIPPAQHPFLWFSGRRVPWEQATVDVPMVGWPVISAVFEATRAYWTAEHDALYVFRLREHIARLQSSMKLLRMRSRFSSEALIDALLDLLRANGVREDAYIQPLAFVADSSSGNRALMEQTPEIVITTRPYQSGLLSGHALTAGVSSWTRISDNSLPPRIKAIPNYANARLAANEAKRHGYDVPILLNNHGQVAESSGSCIFFVRNGVAVTPPVTASILESITRDAALALLRESLGVPVLERDVDRTELYTADEIFLCGTAMEISPVTSVDGYAIGTGQIGDITTRLERCFHDVARGNESRYAHWRTRA